MANVHFEEPEESVEDEVNFTQIFAALAVSLVSLTVGFVTAYTSPATETMLHKSNTFEVTEYDVSWIGSIMPLAALAGAVIGGFAIEYLGRRSTLVYTSTPFIVGGLLITFAQNVEMIYLGRFLCGLSVGLASLTLPVYLSETIHPTVRGALGLLPTTFGNFGILLAYAVGAILDWRYLALFGSILAGPILLLIFLPETPRWHVGRGSLDSAKKSLLWLRGKKANVDFELSETVRMQTKGTETRTSNRYLTLFKKPNRKPFTISLFLMFFQQLSGINAVIFYTVEIFHEAETVLDSNICTIIVGIVNFLSTFIAIIFIDRLGRKILLYISAIIMVITLFLLGLFFFLKLNTSYDVDDFNWITLVSLIFYIIGFSMGFGPIPWLMMGELLPAKIRERAASVVTSFNWMCTFIVTKSFQDIIRLFGIFGAFWLFSAIVFIGIFFVMFFLPETSGRTLEEIESKIFKRSSSIAKMRPLAFNAVIVSCSHFSI